MWRRILGTLVGSRTEAQVAHSGTISAQANDTNPSTSDQQKTVGGEVMSEEMITVDNLSQELLKQVFDGAYMQVFTDNQGDIYVQDRCKCWLFPDKEKRHIRLHAQFGFKPDSSDLQRLECVNMINRGWLIVRATVGKNNALIFNYDVSLDGGISRKYLVLLVKRFCSIPHDAVSDCGKDIVE